MADTNEVQFEMGPPLSEAEAELIWYAPAGGLSTALIAVLFMDLAIVIVLLISQMFLLAVALLLTIAMLVGFSLVNAAYLLGPGGVTVQRPFGTQSHVWSDFRGWRPDGSVAALQRVQPEDAPPLRLHTRDDLEALTKVLPRYLPELPGGEQAPVEDARADG